MKRSLVGLTVAIVLAVGGMFVLVSYVNGAEQRVLAGERVVTVLVVTEPITKGTSAAELSGHIAERQVPAKVQADGAIADLSDVEGLVAAVNLVPGEQLVSSRFLTPEELREETRLPIPDGFQRVAIALTPAQALGGLVTPGDLVGVVASFTAGENGAASTHLVLNKILVTNVQGEVTQPAPTDLEHVERDQAPSQAFLVTVAVDAASAERLVFAAEHGSIWLTLQSPDVVTDGAAIQTIEKVFQ